jgi:4-amino-4-deoxy-L-arabinose transferase-like glycosyltransferase
MQAVAPSAQVANDTPIFPLPSPEGTTPWLTPRQLDRWVLAFVILGLAARCVRYFLRFPLWEDECFLCANLMDRDYDVIFESLNYHQAAPMLFLAMQLTVIKLLGFHEMALRLIPFLAGLGSILLYWRLVQRCLDGVPRLIAMAVFSVTYATIRYSAEAKPYGIDLFVALVLVSFTVNWLQQPGRATWLWALAAAIPVAIGFSYGAVMLGGGLCLAMAWVIWRQRRWESLAPWAVYTAAMLAAFATVYLLSIRVQEAGELEALREMWKEHFPPLTGLVDFAYWMLHTHTGDILAYPAGGSPFQSSLSALFWFAALVALVRRKQGTVLMLCLAPLAVTFVAALMQRFPYGGHIRLNLYMAPWMCLLIGYGLAVLLAALTRRGCQAQRSVTAVALLLALVGAVTVVRDLGWPYKNISDQRMRAFAEWFWYNAEHDSEVACIKTDLGRVFSPETFHDLSFSAEYLCNQRIYSPRRAAGDAIHWDRVSATHPLRCVLYRCPQYSFDEAALKAWLDEMQEQYVLVSREVYPEVRQGHTRRVVAVDYLEIFHFIPRIPPAGAAHVATENRVQ